MRTISDTERAGRIPRRTPLAVLVCAACVVSALVAHADDRPPNVVLMLSDNLGFGEIGVYGGGALRGAPTPRIDIGMELLWGERENEDGNNGDAVQSQLAARYRF